MSAKSFLRLAFVIAGVLVLTGCIPGGGGSINAAFKQIPAEAQVLLAKKGMTEESPIFVRIFKEESQLEIWKQKADGRFHHFKTYPICTWSGELGPKVKQGDKQSPEGFYTVTPGQMNPNSQFHLSFNLGFPNTYDKVQGRTGSALMVHGDCRSAGCYAMTDALIEEIYAIAREAFKGGQRTFNVHAFPFRMTAENMKRHSKDRWYSFWKTLKPGYDDFELTRKTPKVSVCSKRYLINAEFFGQVATPNPADNCPAYRREPGTPFVDAPLLTEASASQAAVTSSRVAAYNADKAETADQITSSTTAPAATPQESTLSSQAAQLEQKSEAAPAAKAPVAPYNSIHNVVGSNKSDLILPNAAPQ
jgi:murein L,D-transpeptidase YafK